MSLSVCQTVTALRHREEMWREVRGGGRIRGEMRGGDRGNERKERGHVSVSGMEDFRGLQQKMH